MDQADKDKRKKTIGMAVGAVCFALTYLAFHYLFSPSIDKQMMAAASEMNKTCPVMVDKVTRWDNTVALPDKTFQYNYTIITMERSAIDTNSFKSALEPNLVANARTNPGLKIFRDNKLTLAYNYRDKNGAFIQTIYITPEKYMSK